MDHSQLGGWLRRYIDAWLTYDADAIGALFSESVRYRYHPHDEPTVGREAVVRSWLEAPDPTGTYEAHYEPLAVDGDLCIAVGHSTYRRASGTTEVFDNLFVMRFDDDGRCNDFTEWYVKRPS